jgi:hypothetical protein
VKKSNVAVQISIPEHCMQSWESMSSVPTGRHCGECQKVVVDFTRMSDAQLLAYFQNYYGSGSCGRFRQDQVGLVIKPFEKPRGSYCTRIATTILLLLSTFKGTIAQTKAVREKAKQVLSPGKSKPKPVNQLPTVQVKAKQVFHAPIIDPQSEGQQVLTGAYTTQKYVSGRILDSTRDFVCPPIKTIRKDSRQPDASVKGRSGLWWRLSRLIK